MIASECFTVWILHDVVCTRIIPEDPLKTDLILINLIILKTYAVGNKNRLVKIRTPKAKLACFSHRSISLFETDRPTITREINTKVQLISPRFDHHDHSFRSSLPRFLGPAQHKPPPTPAPLLRKSAITHKLKTNLKTFLWQMLDLRS